MIITGIHKSYALHEVSPSPTSGARAPVGAQLPPARALLPRPPARPARSSQVVEQGINHMWTVSAIQQHPKAMIVCDEDATMELKVKTVRYFKALRETAARLLSGVAGPAANPGAPALKAKLDARGAPDAAATDDAAAAKRPKSAATG